MSPHAYTEDQLVEQPALGLFATLGWQTMTAYVSISIASYLGYDEIYIAGFDNDSFKTVQRVGEHIEYYFSHFYDASPVRIKTKESITELIDLTSQILRLHERANVINLDKDNLSL
jgi:hypothetical protein